MHSSQILFITGTDTDVGKTIVAAALIKGLNAVGRNAHYWKPIQAGLTHKDSDFIEQVASICSLPSALEIDLAASPDQGLQAIEQTGLTAKELFAATPKSNGLLIIEGAGGLLVPINAAAETWADLLKLWRCPVLVVARTGLGTLNHTALTVRHLLDLGAEVAGIVLNGPRHKANEDSLQRLLPDVPFVHFPFQANLNNLHLADCKNLAEFAVQSASPLGDSWRDYDRKYVWHPYTQHKLSANPPALVGAYGPWIFTSEGEKLIDASSSWWVNTIGHGRNEIRQAISRQQAKMDHVIFANATHQPGSELAGRLVALADGQLKRVFYSDNGSTSVEVGLKMAFQAWHNRGEKHRTKFLSLQASYHGDTIGTMAVGNSDGFHRTFKPLFFPSHHIAPVTSHVSKPCPGGVNVRDQSLQDLEEHLLKFHHEYAAFLCEPLIQGAGGMLVHDQTWLRDVVNLCRKFGLYIILDEVFTGMGRVGNPFAFQRANISPDIVCVAKGLTGGTLPLAATLSTEEVFLEFLSEDPQRAFLHGHSYTGNPIACAAAIATLDIFEQEKLSDRALYMEKQFSNWWTENSSLLPISNGRVIGGVLAMELGGPNEVNKYFDPRALEVPSVARRHGLFLRPLGNTIYLVLPLTISSDELDFALSGLTSTLTEFCGCQ